MNLLFLLLILAFAVYYAYAFYVFQRLYENHCSCKKLEIFKQSWNYKMVYYLSPVFLTYNVYILMKMILQNQNGGDIYNKIIVIVVMGYALTFVYDYALISLLRHMQSQKCPCQVEHRNRLEMMTYVKSSVNVLALATILRFTDKVLVKKALNKAKK